MNLLVIGADSNPLALRVAIDRLSPLFVLAGPSTTRAMHRTVTQLRASKYYVRVKVIALEPARHAAQRVSWDVFQPFPLHVAVGFTRAIQIHCGEHLISVRVHFASTVRKMLATGCT